MPSNWFSSEQVTNVGWVHIEISTEAFGFWLSLVLKEIMVPGRSFNLPASKCLYRSVADPREGPGGPASLTTTM